MKNACRNWRKIDNVAWVATYVEKEFNWKEPVFRDDIEWPFMAGIEDLRSLTPADESFVSDGDRKCMPAETSLLFAGFSVRSEILIRNYGLIR